VCLLCPVCGSRQVALLSLACASLRGQRGDLLVDHRGLHLDPQAIAVEGGSSIAITYRCSLGHRFSLRLRTIYDTTVVETVALSRSPLDGTSA